LKVNNLSSYYLNIPIYLFPMAYLDDSKIKIKMNIKADSSIKELISSKNLLIEDHSEDMSVIRLKSEALNLKEFMYNDFSINYSTANIGVPSVFLS